MIKDKKKILELKNKHSKRMMEKHSLTGIGIGYKTTNGIKTDKLSMVFLVEKKLPKNEIPKDKLLPPTLEDVECDVIETGEIKALAYTDKIRPAEPGYSIGHPDITAGTLGCVVYKDIGRYILSNNHVMAHENAAEIGDPIYQPGVYDGGVADDTVAYLDSFVTLEDNATVDGALAIITNNELVTNVGQWGSAITSYSDPEVDDTVYKTGRTTENTTGTVLYEHTDVNINYTDLGVLLIKDCFITDYMADGGDSGSVGRSSDTNAVGLLFAGSSTRTIFNYMSNVVTELGFTFTEPSPRYWVGGEDDWDSTAGSKWSLTDGGAGGASVPTSDNNVYIKSGVCTITEAVSAGTLTHTEGTLDTNDQTLTVTGSFITSGAENRTLDFGSSTINCGSFTYSGSGLTLIEGTSTIIVANSGNFNGNGETYYEVQLNDELHTITGANTFTTLTRTGTATLDNRLTLSANQTITGTFTLTSNSVTNLIFVRSNESGTQRTITAATFTINYASFKDIVCAGAGTPAVPTSAQNLGNNSGITFPTAIRYWVGGAGNWSDGTNHWSLTSSGSAGHTSPGITDDTYFDSNSHNDAYTVTVDKTFYSKDLTFAQPSSGAVTFAGTETLYIYGDLTLVDGMVYSSTGSIYFKATDAGHTITLAGNTADNPIYFDGVSGEWTLQDEFNISENTITLTNGSFVTNDQTVTCDGFESSNSNTRSLTLGSSEITCSGLIAWDINTITNLTFDAGTSTIIFTSYSIMFYGGGLTYYEVQFTCAYARIIITGANTFTNLIKTNTVEDSGASFTTTFRGYERIEKSYIVEEFDTLRLYGDQTITGVLTLTGSSTVPLLVYSSSKGTQRTITAANVSASYTDFQDILGAGADDWDLSSITGGSGDCGGNTDITFTTPATQYWYKNTGDWSDNTKWFLATNGGGGAGRVPLPQDDVVFDANSMDTDSQVITVDRGRIGKNITFANITDNPILDITSWDRYDTYYFISIFGSLTMGTLTFGETTIHYYRMTLLFEGRDSYTLTSNGVSFNCRIGLDAPSGTLTLQDNLLSTARETVDNNTLGGLFIANGTFNANNYNLNIAGIWVDVGAERTINMGSGTWILDGHRGSWTANPYDLTINADTSLIKLTNNSSIDKYFYGDHHTYYNLWNVTEGSGKLIFTDTNTFNDIKIDAGRETQFTGDTTQTVTTFTANGSEGNLITLTSYDDIAYTLTKAGGGTIECDYIDVSKCTAMPEDTWYAGVNSVDSGDNTGWDFATTSTSSTSTSSSSTSVSTSSSSTSTTTILVGNIIGCDSNNDKFYKHNGFSAGILDSFSSPSTAPKGLTHDGSYFYSIDSDSDKVYKHSGFSNTILDSFATGINNPDGITVDDNYFYVSDNNFENTKHYKFSGFSATILDSFSTDGIEAKGITIDFYYFYYSVAYSPLTGINLYKSSAFGGTVLDSFNHGSYTINGITAINTNLCITDSGNKIYKFSGFSTTVLDSFVTTNEQYLAYDDYDARMETTTSTSTSSTSISTTSISTSSTSTTEITTSTSISTSSTSISTTTILQGDIISSDYNTDKIYKHSGFSSTILDSFASPSTYPREITIDNNHLYSLDDDTNKIYKHSGFSPTIIDSINIPSNNPRGITVDNKYLYSSKWNSPKFYKHSGFSSTILDSFASPSTPVPSGLTIDNNYLYSSDNNTDKFYKYSGFSSTILDSFASPSTSPLGLTIDDNYLYSSDSASDKIYKHSGFSLTVLDSFNSPDSNPIGLTQDNYDARIEPTTSTSTSSSSTSVSTSSTSISTSSSSVSISTSTSSSSTSISTSSSSTSISTSSTSLSTSSSSISTSISTSSTSLSTSTSSSSTSLSTSSSSTSTTEITTSTSISTSSTSTSSSSISFSTSTSSSSISTSISTSSTSISTSSSSTSISTSTSSTSISTSSSSTSVSTSISTSSSSVSTSISISTSSTSLSSSTSSSSTSISITSTSSSSTSLTTSITLYFRGYTILNSEHKLHTTIN